MKSVLSRYTVLYVFLIGTSSWAAAQTMSDTLPTTEFHPNERFAVSLQYSMGNFFRMYNATDVGNYAGFLLGALSLEKKLKRNTYWYAKFSMLADSPQFIPVEYEACNDTCESVSTISFMSGLDRKIKLNNNQALGIGMGLSSTRYKWLLYAGSYDSLLNYTGFSQHFSHWGFGFDSHITYLINLKVKNQTHALGIGLNYSPTFINGNGVADFYQHTVFFNIFFRVSGEGRKKKG